MNDNTHLRGFASMDSGKQKEIARKGGVAAHIRGTAHEFSQDEARAAGKLGGQRVSNNRSHMSEIGRLGGKISAARRKVFTPQSQAISTLSGQVGEQQNDGGMTGGQNAAV